MFNSQWPEKINKYPVITLTKDVRFLLRKFYNTTEIN